MKIFSFSTYPKNVFWIIFILVLVCFEHLFFLSFIRLSLPKTAYSFSKFGNSDEKFSTFINQNSGNTIETENEFSNEFNFSNLFKQTVISEKEIFDLTEKESNLAINYWSEWKQFDSKNVWDIEDVIVCNTEFPSPLSIKFNNIYWQSIINTQDLTIFLLNAYYDNRRSTKKVRIIAVTDHYKVLERKKLW
jgi:hypothetical protein